MLKDERQPLFHWTTVKHQLKQLPSITCHDCGKEFHCITLLARQLPRDQFPVATSTVMRQRRRRHAVSDPGNEFRFFFFVMYSELIRCDSRTLLIFAIACRNVLPFTVAVLVQREVEKQHSCKRGQQSFLEFCCMCVSFAPAAIYRTSDAFQCLIIFSRCMRFGSIPPS